MHNQIISTSGMDHESHLAPDHGAYSNENWVDMNGFSHAAQTTMPDYGSNFAAYMAPMPHGLPSESLNRMPPPPPVPVAHPAHPHPPPLAQAHPGHPPLPMLMVPSHPTWPSMLTNPSGLASASSYSAPPTHGGYPATPVSIQPLSAGIGAPPQGLPKHHRPSHSQPAPRKTLTDDDRRRMCEYAEANPGTRQTEIGAKFGVERSTVSKVLRQKEKFLNMQEDRSAMSPAAKRARVKLPDIEKAMSVWIRNHQKSGMVVTDDDIKERFKFFAANTGSNSAELLAKANSSNWLEKFKQKNSLGGLPGRLLRRASETNIPDRVSMNSPLLSTSQPSASATISPASPTGQPSPLSATKSEDEKDGTLSQYMDFTSEAGSALSPTAPFTFSPDPNTGGFLSTDPSRSLPPGSSGFQRPRSQTFPTLDIESLNTEPPAYASHEEEPLTPKYSASTTAPPSALESPMSELPGHSFGIDRTISSASPRLRHSASNSSIGRVRTGAGTPVTGLGGGGGSGGGTSPTSPTQDDACRAADTLLSFLENMMPNNGLVDQTEYLAIVQLTKKLRLQTQQQQQQQQHMPFHQIGKPPSPVSGMGFGLGMGMGGLSRIPEGEVEMGNTHTHPHQQAMMQESARRAEASPMSA